MIIKKPEYYDEFVCTADQCPFTCCREWKIEVDNETNEKWKKLQAPESVYPVRKNMSQYTQKKDNMRVIALNKKHICPFLNEQKLCRLVCTFGDDVLSKTCRVFPREIHKFLDQEEFFLMPSCPAVIDLMKKYPNCNYIETGAENIEKEKNSEFNELNFLRNVRSIFSDWMRRKEFDPQENLKHIFFAALELWRIWQENSNEDFLFSDDFNAQIKKNLKEYKTKKLQKELADAISKIPSDQESAIFEQNELFLDLTTNYEREGLYKSELKDVLNKARLIEEENSTLLLEQKRKFNDHFSKWQELFRSFLTAEIESDCLLPDGNLQDFIVHLEWIALEYTAIKQFLFLDWMQNGSLTYEKIRDTITLVCRMTGYEEDDIYEYMQDCFDDVVWEWGYLAFILT